ncbi:hypothetical protein ACFPVT_04940 [Corynebacterium choanae]|uniref:hypothetical protein n=1 Tax=Corynebacterium choanae TaxID=1862358 RepID=UPI000F4F1534|nr:hypothetical protein [Corynebacterium choanae]
MDTMTMQALWQMVVQPVQSIPGIAETARATRAALFAAHRHPAALRQPEHITAESNLQGALYAARLQGFTDPVTSPQAATHPLLTAAVDSYSVLLSPPGGNLSRAATTGPLGIFAQLAVHAGGQRPPVDPRPTQESKSAGTYAVTPKQAPAVGNQSPAVAHPASGLHDVTASLGDPASAALTDAGDTQAVLAADASSPSASDPAAALAQQTNQSAQLRGIPRAHQPVVQLAGQLLQSAPHAAAHRIDPLIIGAIVHGLLASSAPFGSSSLLVALPTVRVIHHLSGDDPLMMGVTERYLFDHQQDYEALLLEFAASREAAGEFVALHLQAVTAGAADGRAIADIARNHR